MRRTGTFDRHRRLGEQRATALHFLNQLPCVRRQIVAVVRRHTVAAQRFFQTFHRFPIQLKPRRHDQTVVFHHAAAIEDNGVIGRFERGHGGLDPLDPARDERTHGLRGFAGFEDATAHHGPARLVIVDIRRIDDRDRDIRFAGVQAGCDRNTARATTYNNHIILGVACFGGCFATVGDASGHAVHVVARRFGCSQDFRHGTVLGFVEGPQSRGTCPRPAVSQRRARQRIKRRTERFDILIRHHPRLDRHIARLQTGCLGSLLDFIKAGLVGTFAVRTVTDNRPESGFFDGGHVVWHDLRRNAQMG